MATASPGSVSQQRGRRIPWIAYFLVAPYLLYNLVFWAYPFVWGAIISLEEWNIIAPTKKFVGMKNFIHVWHNPQFWNALHVTFRFWIVFLPAVTVASLGLAMMLQRIRRFRGFYIAGFLASYTMAGVAYSVVFNLLLTGNGWINTWLWRLFHVRVPWFTSPKLALISIAMIVVWKFVGYYGLIFLAGLNSIPQEMYEAAALDGANPWQRFWKITVPLLNPSFTVVFVFATILSFGIFTEPYLITGGGPMGSTETFMLLIYQKTFEDLQAGYGSALAISMAALSYAATFLVRKGIEREVYW